MLTHSEDISELAKALSAFQGEVQNATKNSRNPFFNSTYADLGEVLNVARPLLGKHGLSLFQSPNFIGTKEEGYVTVASKLLHSSGQWMQDELSTPVFATTGKSGKTELVSAQTVGSAITYCRRYAAAAFLGISQQDDDGNATSGKDTASNPRETKPVEPKLSPKWTEDEIREFGKLMEAIRGHHHVMNKFEAFEDFSDKVIKCKESYQAKQLLEMMQKREKDFAAEANQFVAVSTADQPTLLES